MRSVSRLILPPDVEDPWPTLGPQVADWIEANLVHGPGDLLGEPIELTLDNLYFLYRAYEVYPRDHEQAGRRRFKRAVKSRRKGTGKTEEAAWIALAELDPAAPVRCDGWRQVDGEWEPVGRPVYDPYIPMVAVTEEQTDDLAYGAAYAIVTHSNCGLVDDYDPTLERITHKSAPGELKALASAPSARDGARTTFQHFDETHLFNSHRLRDTHSTMLRNIPKRQRADAWSLETTTMFAPGEESVAESAHKYAMQIQDGNVDDPRILYDHLQASEAHDLKTKSGLHDAIVEASGAAITYTDVGAIKALWYDPQTKENEFRRYWCNQPRKTSEFVFEPGQFEDCANPQDVPVDGTRIVLSFDGSYSRDSTALFGTTLDDEPYGFLIKAWEKPHGAVDWRTPRTEVDEAVTDAMNRWQVVELACDPPGWVWEIEAWQERYGDVVVHFDTNQITRMGPACDKFYQAVCDGEYSHDGSPALVRHVANMVPHQRGRYKVFTKSSTDSDDKIDIAIAAVIGLERATFRRDLDTAEVRVELW